MTKHLTLLPTEKQAQMLKAAQEGPVIEPSVEELARRIAAAVISWEMGNRSIDHARKAYVPDDEPIGSAWLHIARQLADGRPKVER